MLNQTFQRIVWVLFWMTCALTAVAQHVQVNLVIPPPYPIHLEKYLQFSNQTVITVQNLSSETRQIKLIASVTGDNGVSAHVRQEFIPTMPIVLNPMETRVLTGSQLRNINGNLGDGDVNVTGANKATIMQTETLPEGAYSICLEPRDYITNVSYVSPAGPGCANIFLTHYDVPEIIVPSFGQEVMATTPQFVNFAWTPSGIASNTRYRFELVDMFVNNLNNINDAFANPAVQMHYTQQNLMIPNLQYDISKPPLIPGRQYAVRVVAYDPSQQTVFKNNGEGPVSTFYYKPQQIIQPNIVNNDPIILDGGGGGGSGDDNLVFINWPNNIKLPDPKNDDNDIPEDLGDCHADCTLQAPQGAPASIIQGQPVQVGMFQMDILSLNGNSGEGTILVPFLKTKVRVVFNNLQVVSGNVMSGGQIYAKLDPGSSISQAIASNQQAALEGLHPQLPQLLQEVQSNAKKLSFFNENQPPVSVPFSMDNKGMDMVIAGIVFTPTRAYMHMIAGVETLTNAISPYLALSRSGVGIRPNGFCNDSELKIALVSDRELSVVENGPQEWVRLKFKGDQGANKTFLTFTCQGVHTIQLDAELVFGKDIVVPVNQQGNEQNGNLSVTIKTTLQNNLKDWYIEGVQFAPTKYFTLPALKGFVMEASTIVFDQHSGYTPQGMQFHPQHPSAGGNNQLWKGLYIGNLSVQFPAGFNKNGEPLKVSMNNMMLDKTGLWGTLNVQNILQINNGDLGGWAFSINQFTLDIQESKIVSGGFSGDIELPITTFGVPYAIQLAGQQGNEYTFGISPNTDITMDMWIASLKIGQSSSIKITKAGNSFIPSAVLNGQVSIGWDKNKFNQLDTKPNVNKFQIPTVAIEGMEIITQNGLPKIQKFGLPSLENLNLPQGELFAFKINLTKFAIVNNNEGENGLQIGLSLGFDNSGNGGTPLIGGATVFTLYPKLENKKFKFSKTTIDEVTINATVGPAEINGSINIYSDHNVYGNGFRGWVQVKMPPIGLEDLQFTLQVGTAPDPDPFRYWMVDASIKLNVGITVGPGIAIYGFGGGFWYNMTRQGPENKEGQNAVNINDMVNASEAHKMTPGHTDNGIVYNPSKGTFGFKANVILGLSGSSAAFNADVGLVMELQSNFSFNFVEFYGVAYLMQPMENRGDAFVTGSVKIKVETKNVNPNGPVLTGGVAISLNVATLLDVSANLSIDFMFSKQAWYVYFGSWDGNYDPKEDPKRNRIEIGIPLVKVNAQFNCYFMIGTQIPSNLPPLPSNVAAFFPNAPKSLPQNAKNATSAGLGFATGAGIHLDVNFKFAIIYVDVKFDMGFDVLVQQAQGNCGNIANPGIGGWYAKGQAYVYCHVEGGLEINLWFFKGRAPFVAFTAGALLQVQGPNPTWINGRIKFEVAILGGLIKINTQVVADIGEKCDTGAGSPFDDIPIVSYVDPADKSKKVDCYTNPQIVFNFPKTPFKYEVLDEKTGDPIYKGYSVKLKSYKFTYKDKDNKTKTIVFKDQQWAKDGYSVLLRKKDILPGLTDISYEIVTQGYEHHMNGFLISNQIKTAFDEQITKGTFTTDSFPDYIPLHDILYAIPALGQRYFLMNEQAAGAIEMNQMSCSDLFKPYDGETPNLEFKYLARFKELRTNKTWDLDCQCANKKVTYALPADMKLSRMYSVEIIRQTRPIQDVAAESKSKENWRKLGDWGNGNIYLPNPNIIQFGQGGGNGPNNQFVLPPNNQNPNINQGIILLPPNQQGNNIQQNYQQQMINPNNIPNLNNIQANVNQGNQNNPWQQNDLNIANKPDLPLIAMEAYDRAFVERVTTIEITEKILFTNYFKNSKYNTKATKLAQMQEDNQIFSQTYPIVPAMFEGADGNSVYLNKEQIDLQVPIMLIKSDEGLDVYDVYGYMWTDLDIDKVEHENMDAMYKIHPPIFRLESGYDQIWLRRPYAFDKYDPSSLFFEPDEENFKYKMDIYDPAGDEPFSPLQYQYSTPRDMRPFIFWPEYNDWDAYIPTMTNDHSLKESGPNSKLFWRNNRFAELAFFESMGPSNATLNKKFATPFMLNIFKYAPRVLPTPQDLQTGDYTQFLPAEWYTTARHKPVNFGNRQIMQIEGKLKQSEINAEIALAPQQGNPNVPFNQQFQANVNQGGGGGGAGMLHNSNQFQSNVPRYLAIIDFSEWMAKKDHVRMVNKILYDFREDCCLGCGINIASLATQKDAGYGNYQNPNDMPKDQGFDQQNDVPFMDWRDFRYTFKYLPMRAWLLHIHRYNPRGAQHYRFKMDSKEFQFFLPNYSQNAAWPTDYGVH